MRRLIATAIVTVCAGAAPSMAAAQGNEVRILRVEPVGPLTSVQVAEFIVEVEVDLRSAFQAALQVGFNDRAPDSFRTVATEPVQAGRRTLTLRARSVYMDWGERGDFSVRANVGPWTADGIWRPYAEAVKAVADE
jgi:hypothetical protein